MTLFELDALSFRNFWWGPLVVLSGAVLIELICGEPPNAVHPVVFMGRLTDLLLRAAPKGPEAAGHIAWAQLLFGAAVSLIVPTVFALLSAVLLFSLESWPGLQLLTAALLLSTSFSLKALGRAALEMHHLLSRGELEQARFSLRNLCSRDASRLTESELTAATIESVAENTSDSFVAPLFFFALFGVPGAIFYRAVNTLDAMIGYRGNFEYLGKTAAKLDDVLNYLPARFTAFLLLLAGRWLGYSWKSAREVVWQDHRNTESPNAGWPMAATAGLLGITLEKAEHYRLGRSLQPLRLDHILQAWRLAQLCFLFAVLSCAGLGLCVAFLRGQHV